MKKFYFGLITLLLTLVAVPSQAQLDELSGKVIAVGSAATEITSGQWYIMQNGGRGAYAYENGSQALMAIKTTDVTLAGALATDYAGYLVRFLPVEGQDGSYYMQSGTGRYWGELTTGSNNGTTETADKYFVSGKISGYDNWFDFVGNNGEMVLDCNAAGGTVTGWGTDLPTSTSSNAAWQILPVTLTSESDMCTATITYKYNMDDQTMYSYTQTQRGLKTGFEVTFDAPATRYGVTCSDATKASESITEDKSFEVVYNYTVNTEEAMPFQTTTIAEDGTFAVGTKWYYITPEAGSTNFAYSTDDDDAVYYQKQSTHPIDLHYMFCFTGNPLKGYRIHNYKKSGTTSVDGSDYVTFTEAGAGYFLQKGYTYSTKGDFAFNLSTNADSYLNAYGSQLTIYTWATWAYSDTGSGYNITEVTAEELAQAIGGVLSCEPSPADGSVWSEGESMDAVQLTFDGSAGELSDDAIAIVEGMEEGKITLTDADGNVVATPAYEVDEDSKSILDIVFDPAINTPGKFYLNIPAGLVKGTTTGLKNQDIMLTYSFTAPFEPVTVTARIWKSFKNDFKTYNCWPYNLPYATHADGEYYTCKINIKSRSEIELIDWEGAGDETDILNLKFDPTVEITSSSTHNGKTINDLALDSYSSSWVDTKVIYDDGYYGAYFYPTYSNCVMNDDYGQVQIEAMNYADYCYYWICADWYFDDRYARDNAAATVYNAAFKDQGYDYATYTPFQQLPYENGSYSATIEVVDDNNLIVRKYDGKNDIQLTLDGTNVVKVNGEDPDEYSKVYVSSDVIDGVSNGWYCYCGDQGYSVASYSADTKSGYIILSGWDSSVSNYRYIYIGVGDYEPELDSPEPQPEPTKPLVDTSRKYNLYNTSREEGAQLAWDVLSDSEACVKYYDAESATQQWQFVAVDESANQYKIQNCSTGQFLASIAGGGENVQFVADEASAAAYTIHQGTGSVEGQYAFSSGSATANWLFADSKAEGSDNYRLDGWSDGLNEFFYMVEVTEPTEEYEYIVDANDGAFGHGSCSSTGSSYSCLWTSTKTEPTTLTLTAYNPDGTLVNNMKDEKSTGTSFYAYTGNAGNSYKSSYELAVGEGYQIVSYSFEYTKSSDNLTVTLADGTEYVSGETVEAGAQVAPRFTIDSSADAAMKYIDITNFKVIVAKGQSTGISSVSASSVKSDGAVYNIAGQKMNSLRKGLNIVNGKKIVY